MSTTVPNAIYDDYLQKRDSLTALIKRQIEVLSHLEMAAWQGDVNRLLARVQNDNFKVLVMGEFNRGKSTFINALLGQKVLPAYAVPTTAIINEVKWGTQQRAFLHALRAADGTIQEPREIPVEQIKDYVIIKDTQQRASSQQVTYQSPYEKVELFWPLEICRDGVEIIDSPGLNEDIERQKITLEYLKTVDVVLYVIACDFPVSSTEIQVIKTIKDAGHEHTFFICNRMNMIDDEERDMVKHRCLSLLVESREEEKFVFFIDARGALEGKLRNSQEQLRGSHLLEVEGMLKTFLATERGRIKIVRPATELKASIREARRSLPEREKMLHTDLQTLLIHYDKAKGELDQLEAERHQIYVRLQNFRAETKRIVFDAARSFYTDMASQVPTWTADYQIQEGMGMLELFSHGARERVVSEVTAFLTNQVKEEFDRWKTATFEPLIASRFSSLARELDEKTKKFADDLEQVRLDMVSSSTVALSGNAVNQDKISVMERILAAAGGFLIGDISSAALGATFGFNEMLKSLIPQFAIAVAVTAIIGFNPVILIPALLLGGGFQAFLKKNSINKKIKDAVGNEYEQKLRELRGELAENVAASVDQKLSDIQSALGRGLGLELQNVRDQVDSIIRLKQQQQSKVDEALLGLQAINDSLNAIEVDVDELINQVALSKTRY